MTHLGHEDDRWPEPSRGVDCELQVGFDGWLLGKRAPEAKSNPKVLLLIKVSGHQRGREAAAAAVLPLRSVDRIALCLDVLGSDETALGRRWWQKEKSRLRKAAATASRGAPSRRGLACIFKE